MAKLNEQEARILSRLRTAAIPHSEFVRCESVSEITKLAKRGLAQCVNVDTGEAYLPETDDDDGVWEITEKGDAAA